jgi:hypothetical protein
VPQAERSRKPARRVIASYLGGCIKWAHSRVQEIQHYLSGHTGNAWDRFLRGIENGHQRLDKVTVNALELRAPGTSIIDAQLLRG